MFLKPPIPRYSIYYFPIISLGLVIGIGNHGIIRDEYIRVLKSARKMPRRKLPDILLHTFKLTVSPKSDIKEECYKQICKTIETTCEYYYGVTERGESGKLHLHVCFVHKLPSKKKVLRNNIAQRSVKPFHNFELDETVLSVAVRVDVMYDHKWYEEYLRKEEHCTVLIDKYDRDAVSAYFPTAQQQKLLQELQNVDTSLPLVHEFVLDIQNYAHDNNELIDVRYIVQQVKYYCFQGRFIPRDQRAFDAMVESIWRVISYDGQYLTPQESKLVDRLNGDVKPRKVAPEPEVFAHLGQVYKEALPPGPNAEEEGVQLVQTGETVEEVVQPVLQNEEDEEE